MRWWHRKKKVKEAVHPDNRFRSRYDEDWQSPFDADRIEPGDPGWEVMNAAMKTGGPVFGSYDVDGSILTMNIHPEGEGETAKAWNSTECTCQAPEGADGHQLSCAKWVEVMKR